MLEFFYRLQVFYGFYRGEGRNNGTLEELDKGVYDLMTMASPLTLLEKSVVKPGLHNQLFRGDTENNIH